MNYCPLDGALWRLAVRRHLIEAWVSSRLGDKPAGEVSTAIGCDRPPRAYFSSIPGRTSPACGYARGIGLIYKPFGMLFGILAGLIGKKLFDFVWTKIDDEEPHDRRDPGCDPSASPASSSAVTARSASTT